jgi:hypothetical protein
MDGPDRKDGPLNSHDSHVVVRQTFPAAFARAHGRLLSDNLALFSWLTTGAVLEPLHVVSNSARYTVSFFWRLSIGFPEQSRVPALAGWPIVLGFDGGDGCGHPLGSALVT